MPFAHELLLADRVDLLQREARKSSPYFAPVLLPASAGQMERVESNISPLRLNKITIISQTPQAGSIGHQESEGLSAGQPPYTTAIIDNIKSIILINQIVLEQSLIRKITHQFGLEPTFDMSKIARYLVIHTIGQQ